MFDQFRQGNWSMYGAGSGSTTSLPTVTDPDATFAQITRDQYMNYIKNFRGFEEELLDKASSDTSIIDQAREDADMAAPLATGIAQRNQQRYGVDLTPAQLKEQQRGIQRSTTLGGIQSIQDARIAQREANTQLLGDLINIGQGLNRSSLQQMGDAAANATARNNAYRQAKAQHKANTFSTLGSLGALAILAI